MVHHINHYTRIFWQLQFNNISNDGIVVAEHNDYDDSDSDYSDSEHLLYDEDVYAGEDILFYTKKHINNGFVIVQIKSKYDIYIYIYIAL